MLWFTMAFLIPRYVIRIVVSLECCATVFFCTVVAPLGEFSSAEAFSRAIRLPTVFSLLHPLSEVRLVMLRTPSSHRGGAFQKLTSRLDCIYRYFSVVSGLSGLLLSWTHNGFALSCGDLGPIFGPWPAPHLSLTGFSLNLLVLHRDLQWSEDSALRWFFYLWVI